MDVKEEMSKDNDLEIDMNIVRKLAKDSGYTLTNGMYKGLVMKSESEEGLDKHL